MGGETVNLETCYKNGMISIPIVTGDIIITAIAGNAVVTYTNALLNAVNGNNTKIGNTAWLYQNKRYNSSSKLVDETNVSGTNFSNNMKYIVIQLYKADLSKLIVTVNQEIEVD